MKKHYLFPFIPLLIIAFLLTGCEKNKSVSKEKSPVENSATEEKTSSAETIQTMNEMEEIKEVEEQKKPETIGGKEKSVISLNTAATDNQKFEGSQTLNRFIDDSP